MAMRQLQPQKVVEFDLETTVLDHSYATQRAAATALKGIGVSALSKLQLTRLVRACAAVFPSDVTLHVDHQTGADGAQQHVDDFFRQLELDVALPGSLDAVAFCDGYRRAYRANRRPVAGCVYALVRLREYGFRVAVVSRFPIRHQVAILEAIGIRHLIDRFIGAAGHALESAAPTTSTTHTTYLLGGDMAESVNKAREAQSSSARVSGSGDTIDTGDTTAIILYLPTAAQRCAEVLGVAGGTRPSVARHMGQVPALLGVRTHLFKPRLVSSSSQVTIEGMGFDLVTEPHDGMHLSKQDVRSLADAVGQVLYHVAEERLVAAIHALGNMIRTIAQAIKSAQGKAHIRMVLPPPPPPPLHIHHHSHHHYQRPQTDFALGPSPLCSMVVREHSVVADFVNVVLEPCSDKAASLSHTVAASLQAHCNELMRNYPQAAIRRLRSAMLVIAEVAGVRESIVMTGDNIEPWIGSQAMLDTVGDDDNARD